VSYGEVIDNIEKCLDIRIKFILQEGKEEAATGFVENLLKESDFVVEKIASLANVSVEFVNKVKNRLNGTR